MLMKTVSTFLIAIALISGMAIHIDRLPPPYNPEIRDWHDLGSIRHCLDRNFVLVDNLDAKSAGYERLASRTAHEGKGWVPIGTRDNRFTGSDGSDSGYGRALLLRKRPDDDHG
jgi:hypothetical protein